MSFQPKSTRHRHEYLKTEYANSRIIHEEMPIDPEEFENDGAPFAAGMMMAEPSPQLYPMSEHQEHCPPDNTYFVQALTTPFMLGDVSDEQQRQESQFYSAYSIQQIPQLQEQQQEHLFPTYIQNSPQTPTPSSLPPSPLIDYQYTSATPSYNNNSNNSSNTSANLIVLSPRSPAGDSSRGFDDLVCAWSAKRVEPEGLYAHKTEDVDTEMTAWQPRSNPSSHLQPSLMASLDLNRDPFSRKRGNEGYLVDYTHNIEDSKSRYMCMSPPDSPDMEMEMEMDRLEIVSPVTKRICSSRQQLGGDISRRRNGSDSSSSNSDSGSGRTSSSPKAGGDLRCPECHIQYSRQYNLKTHINRVHRQVRGFICDFVPADGQACNSRFSAKGDLVRHRRIHYPDERPFSCKHADCDKSFPRGEQRDRHHSKCLKTCPGRDTCRHN
ncbi:hypothetical protein EMPS_04585 [Entomortierella parvispora]|uniref:C2H2-type domain-containing protein n=1 Tax=Entomortierella parvispora TaxID=205924 RepID=A0A9P3H9G0_9FUNG|nr:hypothetical protein EMPS_04585 [Entomortierella parvispora]